MKVSLLLSLLGERPLTDVSPEGVQLVELLNRHSKSHYDISTLTGITAFAVLETLSESDRHVILNTELNDGLDLTTYRNQLQNMVDSGSGGRFMKPILAFGFATLLAVMVLGYSAAVGWVAYTSGTLPDWPSLLIVIGGPVMVVWQYYGVLTQERRDILVAALGRTPQGNAIGTLFTSLKVRKADGDPQRRSDDRRDTYDPSKPAD